MATECLLESIVERSGGAILVQDDDRLNGGHVIKSLLCRMACIYKTCHVILSDSTKEAWSQGLSHNILDKVKFHDIYSDPLGWITNSSAVDSFPVLLQHENLSGSALIIDNISSLIIRYHGYTALCRWIHQIEQQCATVCCLLHGDLHDDHVISALHHMMSSVILVEPVSSTSCTGSCSLTHRRKSGKLIKKTELYQISEGYSLTSWAPPAQLTESNDTKTLDPAANLTFDLTLTQQQQADRAQVVLPYTRLATGSSSSGGGRVYYEPDEVDDIDESDPDDDLDI